MTNHRDKLMIAREEVEGVSVDMFRDPVYTVLLKVNLVPKSKFTDRVDVQ